MDSKETVLLRRIGLEGLSKHCGQLILNAISTVFNTDLDKELAKILILRNQNETFSIGEIRKDIIDTLNENEVSDFCSYLGMKQKDYIDGIIKIQNYFDKGYNVKKSEQFIKYFGLDHRFIKVKEVDEREETERITVKYNEKICLKPYLHPYQKRVKDTVIERLSYPGSRLMVQMPTGSGKTFTSLESVVDLLRIPFQQKFAVWIVNTNELAEQALQSFKYVWKVKGDRELNVHRLFKGFEPEISNSEGGMVFTSFPKFYSVLTNPAHPYYQKLWELIKNTEILIIDEAHKSVASTYSDCINAFIGGGEAKVLGLTATPGRNCFEESIELSEMFLSNIVNVTDDNNNSVADALKYLQDENYLAEIETAEFESGVDVDWTNDEHRVLTSLAANPTRNEKILEQIKLADQKEEATVVFACTKDHVLALHILCNGQNIESRFITGDIPQAERLAILEGFKEGKFNILLNLDMLSTGIDLPNTNKIIISRPITSIVLYSQIIGRALRGPLNGGNKKNTLVNLIDNIKNYPSGSFIYKSFSEFWS